MTGSIPWERASSATLGNQGVSPGSSACVTTRTTRAPRERSAFRQACPVSEYAKTAIGTRPEGAAPLTPSRQQYVYCYRRIVPLSSSRSGLRPPRRRVGAEPVDLPHRKTRAAPHLLVDAADVLSDDAQPRHRDPHEGKENREKSEDPFDFRSDDQPSDEQEKTKSDSAQR